MRSRVTLLLCLLVLAAPAAASAQSGDAFSQLTQQQQTMQSAPATSSGTGDGGLQGWQELLIFLGGALLLGGIAWTILSDARRAAPVEQPSEKAAVAKAQREEDVRRRKQRARAASKRARQSRKRNRTA